MFRLLLISQESTRLAVVERLADELPDEICVTCHPAAALVDRFDEVRREASVSDCVVLSHLLTEDHVVAANDLIDRAVPPDGHVLVLQSLRELLQRTRLGGVALSEMFAALPMVGPMLGRVFGSGDMTPTLQRMLRELPRMLDRIPEDRVDLRTFFEAMLYWREPSAGNLRNLVVMLADRWSREPGRWKGQYAAPHVFPPTGLYHPSCGIVTSTDGLPQVEECRGRIGVLLMRGSILANDVAAIDAFLTACASRGWNVLAAFAESFDFREPIERWFDPAGIDAIVSLTGFPLVGGHNRHEADAARQFLESRGVLYFTPPSLMTQSVGEWHESRLGLSPMETAMEVAIHEAEGGLEPLVVQGPAVAGGAKTLLESRCARLLDRIENWIALRRADNRDKKIALTLFSFPPGKGSVGTAAYLDVFASAHAILRKLAAEGYSVDVPETPERLLELVVTGQDKRAPYGGADLAVAARLDVASYERLVPEWKLLRKMWGNPPGELDTNGREIEIHGVHLGNVFVGVQPSFGFEGDPMRLLFEPAATPHHGFVAYYRWIERGFGAHAVVHLGTHGALEFMPGKQVGLGTSCWPDRLLGSVPDVYVYAINNPSEGTIAKRRGYAVTIGHLTPPTEHAGLYRGLEELRALVHEYWTEPGRRSAVGELLTLQVSELHLDRDVAIPINAQPGEMDAFVSTLSVVLREIESRRIPVGLHTVGRSPASAEAAELLAAIAEHDRADVGVRGLVGLVLEANGHEPESIQEGIRTRQRESVDAWTAACETVRAILDAATPNEQCAVASERAPRIDREATAKSLEYLQDVRQRLFAGDELEPLVAALGGRYVAPGAGGDPVRSPDVLPSGRNTHALDPARVPSDAATRQARIAVDLLLAKRRRELGDWPRRIGMVLWGLDNIKTQGEAIAQAFLLLGTRLRRNSIGRVTEIEVIPLEELGRPRIDVTISASGIFRDIFAGHLELLDRAVRIVADLDEPASQNFVRESVAELEPRMGRERAATRVFSNQPGSYGTNVDHMVSLSSWSERGDLVDVWLDRKGYSYGTAGQVRDDRDVIAALAGGIDTTFQNLDSSEVSLVDVDHYFEYLGGMTALVEKHSGKRPVAILADTTTATTRVRDLEETLRLESRTKLLNPRWFEGMLAHGYEGAEEIRKRLDYTFGWSATADAVDEWIYGDVFQTYLEDESVRTRMREANPHSFQAMIDRLVEADGRGFWKPTSEQRARLHELSQVSEDQLEGVVRS